MSWLGEKGWRVWFAATLITLGSVVWQRMSGPTYPIRDRVEVGSSTGTFKFLRSHSTNLDQPVEIRVSGGPMTGVLLWRRYPTDGPWSRVGMKLDGDRLRAVLPAQAPAGKLEYQVLLNSGTETALIPWRPAVTRFKGDVPAKVLIPHIITMFGAMLWSAATGLMALSGLSNLRQHVVGTFTMIAIGGFILGPLVQKAAFGKYWTGFPYGHDLTDNKTLIAGIFWGVAILALGHTRLARGAVITAAAVTLLVFAIPHSMFGSELKWKEQEGRSRSSLDVRQPSTRPVSLSLPSAADLWLSSPGAPDLPARHESVPSLARREALPRTG